jgi:ADP-heptose:LPS heptosyltransferase
VASGESAGRARRPRIVVPTEDRCAAARAMAGQGRPLLIVHPGSGGRRKRAPAALFRTLIERWRETRGGSAVILLGPAEGEEASGWGSVGRVIVPPGVRELAALIASGDAYLGNDSGPTHLAAASGIPGVALFPIHTGTAFRPRGEGLACVELCRPGEDVAGEDVEVSWGALRAALP